MYTITTRTTTKGVARFTCQVRIRIKDGDVSAAQTFGSRKSAEAREKRREREPAPGSAGTPASQQPPGSFIA